MGGFQHFSGPASSYPGKETWKKWPDVFNIYKQSMVNAGSTFDDVGRIFVAITEAAKVGVEERVILAIILNESSGNVGVGTPNDSDGKPTIGLMQCEESPAFPGRNDLPQENITAMVMAGTKHFKRNLQDRGNGDDARTIYEACREYNTGRVNPRNLNDDKTSNGQGTDPDYVSKIVGHLQGHIF